MGILTSEKALQRVIDEDALHVVSPWCHCGEPLDITDAESFSNSGQVVRYRCPVCENTAHRYSPMFLTRPCGADPVEPTDDPESMYFSGDAYTA